MKTVDEVKILPHTAAKDMLYNINHTMMRDGKLYIEQQRFCKILSGNILPGTKKYVSKYDKFGKELLQTRILEFSSPLIYRFSDETVDDYRLDKEILDSTGIQSYKFIAEIIEVIKFYNNEEKEVSEEINSEILIGR